MRIFFIIIILVANCNVSLSQEPFSTFFADAVTKDVPVYSNDTCANHFTIIREYEEKENWHNVEIWEKSDNRYKVHITLYQDSTATPPIDGWIDKEQCGVWLYSISLKQSLWNVYFYKKPDQSCPFLRITSKFPDDYFHYTNGKAAPVLDYKFYNDKYWIKTVIIKNKKKIIGWTTDYCPNVYGACN